MILRILTLFLTSKFITNMKIFSTIIIYFIAQASYSQQFNFNQLIEMTNDNKVFELKMIKVLNSAYKKKNTVSYLYNTIDGDIGASGDVPTNDKKYEEIFEFYIHGLVFSINIIKFQIQCQYYQIPNFLY